MRSFVGLGLDGAAPDHVAVSRARRLIDVETHRIVFTWVQERLVAAGLLKGRTIAIAWHDCQVLDQYTVTCRSAIVTVLRADRRRSASPA